MWRSAAIDSPGLTVSELFPDSLLQHYDIPAAGITVIHGAQYFVWAVLFFIFFCLVFRVQTSVFLSWAGGFARYPVKRTYYDTSPAVRLGLPIGFLVLLPVAAYLVYGTSSVEAPYLLILASLAGYYVMRFLFLAGMAYVSGERDLAAVLSRLSCLFFITATVVYCVILIIGMFLPDLYPVLTGPVSAVAAAVLLLLYSAELLRIFFSFREPLLLTILYLCTLEILPVVTAAVVVVRY